MKQKQEQWLIDIDKPVKKHIADNKKRGYGISLSALYKSHRMRVSLIGDMIVLGQIAYLMGQENIRLKDSEVHNACKYLPEYHDLGGKGSQMEKKEWRDWFLKRNQEGLQEYAKTIQKET